MANYVALDDDPYSNRSYGRGFAYASLVAGAVGLTGWAAIRGYLPGLRPTGVFGQLLIVAMAWVGCGLFVVMATCAWVMIAKSAGLQGTVTVDSVGVLRQVGKRSQLLRWEDIEGIVTMNQEGATLIPRAGQRRINIPGSLDDLRGCISEIKAKGVVSLPSDALSASYQRPRGKVAWWQWIMMCSYATLFTRDSRIHHAERLTAVGLYAALMVWVIVRDRDREGPRWLGWFSVATLFCWLTWAIYYIAHAW
jgi:hypothetical protein